MGQTSKHQVIRLMSMQGQVSSSLRACRLMTLLVATRDSSRRLSLTTGGDLFIAGHTLAGYTLQCKYKGLQNTNTQIRASFSQSGDFIICGSDDGLVYFWGTDPAHKAPSTSAASQAEGSGRVEKNGSYESFHAHDDIVTVAIFGTDAAKQRNLLNRPAPDKVWSIS